MRTIGSYTGEADGPFLVCVAGIHGNEPAGVRALEALFERLEAEPLHNPGFRFRGQILALRGNVQALNKGQRYLRQDLNRAWNPDNIAQIRQTAPGNLLDEDREVHELCEALEPAFRRHAGQKIVVLDLHTNSAEGGIFAIAPEDEQSLQIAEALHAPVIRGMMQLIEGSFLSFVRQAGWAPNVATVAFESGKHDDPLSVDRALAATINCLRTIGCVRPEDVNNEHDELLIAHSRGLPRVNTLFHRHVIHPGDAFRMCPGFCNFQEVHRGMLLAHDRHGPIYAEAESRILMPLYQEQGEDGFFLIAEQ